MPTKTQDALDDMVYEHIVSMGGSFTAARGESFEGNVARALKMPNNVSHRDAYESVCRLVANGRLVKEHADDDVVKLGSGGPIKVLSTKFTAART